jgi:signal peptidase
MTLLSAILRSIRWTVKACANAAAFAVTMATIALAFALIWARFAGLSAYVVMGSSMEPALPLGSLVFVSPMSADAVRVGDVVTVTLPDRVLTHRVVAIDTGDGGPLFTLRGDANVSPDPVQLRPAAIVGVPRFAIPALGYAVTYAEAYWRPALFGLLGCVFFLIALQVLAPHGVRSAARSRAAA